MLAWVYRAASACGQLDRVLVATDSEEVFAFAQRQGWPALMTSPDCASGSDRVYEVSRRVPAEIYVNIQGDEPLLRAEHIEALLRPLLGPQARQEAAVSTLATPCAPEQAQDPNVVKVVTAGDGRALYFSRAPIPYDRDGSGAAPYRKHLGLYAYRRAALERFAQLPPSPLECAERLEQLRLLENGIPIYVENTPYDTIGVDTEEDLKAAEAALLAAARRG